MNRRRFGAALFVAGLVAGTIADDRAIARPEREAGTGNWILAGDFHVHAFFGDAGLAPWDLQREAARARLDVIAVTNHGGLFAGRLNEWWASRNDGPLVLIGQEVTAPDYHLIAAGISRPVDARQTAADAVRDVHAQGGVAIAAHPTTGFSGGWDASALALVDGIERAHPIIHTSEDAAREVADFYRAAAVGRPPPAAIGSSDFHINGPLGLTRTFVIAPAYSRDGVLDAIRAGRTVATDRDGRLYGDPALVARVRAHHERVGERTRPEPGLWTHAATLLAWTGLLALVLGDRP